MPAAMAAVPAYVSLGHIVRPHGLRGALKVSPDTDFPERLAALAEVVLLKDGQPTPVRLEWVRPHGGHLLVKVAGVDSVAQAEAWRGADLAVPRAQAAALPSGRHYVFEVIGLSVVTEAGEELGVVTEILRTGSNDVYVVRGPGHEYLIPAISSVVLAVELAARRIVIRPLPGLLE